MGDATDQYKARRGRARADPGTCLVFAGTLYGIALGGPRWLGAVTPFGGLSLLAAWLGVHVRGRECAAIDVAVEPTAAFTTQFEIEIAIEIETGGF
jgi:hypothetical protein